VSLQSHRRTEVLAGAIALGEATEADVREYREHLAHCSRCVAEFGGERELARVAQRVLDARDSEVWEPDLRAGVFSRMSATPKRALRYGLGALAGCLALSAALHFVVVGGLPSMHSQLADPLVLNYEGNKIVLERRSTRDAKPPAPKVVIVHNIVRLARPAAAPPAPVRAIAAKPAEIPRQVRNVAVTLPATGASNGRASKPVWEAAASSGAAHERDGGAATLSRANGGGSGDTGNAALAGPQTIGVLPSYTTREAEPEGGETAINPRPPAIAFAEGAEGTAAFEVLVDEQGKATKCIITQSSGWPVLDQSTCDAALSVRYRPKTINGRAVPGVYRDAFTFRNQNPQ